MTKPIPNLINNLPEYLVFVKVDRTISLSQITIDSKNKLIHKLWFEEHFPYSYVSNWHNFIDKIVANQEEWNQWIMENIGCWYYSGTVENPDKEFHFMDSNELILFRLKWG